MTELLRDTRFALRSYAKSPGFTAVILISIALGIAANVTVFSVANGLLWGVLPVKDPGRMVMFSEGTSFSWSDYLAYRDKTTKVFQGGITAHSHQIPVSFAGTGEPERILGQAVSGNFFSVLGVPMALGRPILPEEDRVLGRDHVVVVSHSLWKRHFGGDPQILGRAVILNGQQYTIVGVAPAGFRGTERGLVPEFWVPLATAEQIKPDVAGGIEGRLKPGHNWLILNALLKPGVSRVQAAAALNVIKNRLGDSNRSDRKPVTLQTAGGLVGGSATPVNALMTVLMIVVGLVLMMACANVANLLLARAAGRQKELATRMAMGATRWQLVRQLLTESTILALAGGGIGFVLAAVAARALSSIRLPLPVPVVFDFNVDMRVAAFAIGLSLVTALLFGLVPALRATRPDLMAAIKADTAVSAHSRHFGIRNPLVVVQVALSLVLLATAGLFLRSLQKASQIEIGFKPENMLLMAFDPKLQQYSREQMQQFLDQLQTRVLGLPGVRAVSFVDNVPLSISGTRFTVAAESTEGTPTYDADLYSIGTRYWQTIGLPLLRGRDFDLRTDQNVVVVNETLATRLFRNQNPIGRSIRISDGVYTVVGVARDSKSRTLGEAPVGCVYLPLGAAPDGAAGLSGISIVVKTYINPNQLTQSVRRQIAALDPNMAVFNIDTMEEHVNKSLLVSRIAALVLGIFGAAGLTLSAIGMYGVLSYTVGRRSREIGIRIALGATSWRVLAMVLRQGLVVTGTGMTIGLVLALAVGRLSARLLYGVSGSDLGTFLAVPLVLLSAALIAILIPACRATRVDPMVALRCEK